MCVHESPDTHEWLRFLTEFWDSTLSSSTQIHKCMLCLSAGGKLRHLVFWWIRVSFQNVKDVFLNRQNSLLPLDYNTYIYQL